MKKSKLFLRGTLALLLAVVAMTSSLIAGQYTVESSENDHRYESPLSSRDILPVYKPVDHE